jgi:hypothetical protein
VIRHLVEPFERIARARLPQAGSAHNLLLEQPMAGAQYNLDGYVFDGVAHRIGVVDAVHYPDTQAFMRFEFPGSLSEALQLRALEVAQQFLRKVGFTHGLFNMEFFYDAASDRLGVIEFNPRMASQFSDLYLRVLGIDLHQLSLALAHNIDPASLPRQSPSAGAAASFVYRSFTPGIQVAQPTHEQKLALHAAFADSLLFCFAKGASEIARDFKWLGSYRYGIVHLAAADAHQLRLDCEFASSLLGWPAPYADRPCNTSPVRLTSALTDTKAQVALEEVAF